VLSDNNAVVKYW